MGITWRHHIANDAVKQKIRYLLGGYESLLEANRRILQLFGHTTRRAGSLANGGCIVWCNRAKNLAQHCRVDGVDITTCVREAEDRGG